MNFEVKTVLTKKEIMAYQRISGKTVQRGRLLGSRGGLIFIGLAGLTGCAVAGNLSGFNVTVLIGFVLSAMCLMMGINWYGYLTWQNSRGGALGMELTCFFVPEHAVIRSGTVEALHKYSEFIALAESEDYFALFLDVKSGYILPKANFLHGDPAKFRDFLENATGKTVSQVKI